MSSRRKRSALRGGSVERRFPTRRTKTIADVARKVKPIETLTQPRFQTLTPEQLLGPLNDIERKYTPPKLYAAGPLEIPLPRPRMAIVGSRKASPKGLQVAAEIARNLSEKGVIIVSGLAEGVDTAAHEAAIDEGGRTIAVLGTALDRVYPRKNSQLQHQIMTSHLAISQFPTGHSVHPGDFVLRNRTMALISNASIIIEAGEASGSLHQGWEALRLGRPLFIRKPVLDSSLSWPKMMVRYGALELGDTEQVMDLLPSPESIIKIMT